MQKEKGLTSFRTVVDCTMCVHKEKIRDNGEDSYLYSINDHAAVAAVFDGCGGSGSKQYAVFRGKTGAYIASRAVAGAVRCWFNEHCASDKAEFDVASLKTKIQNYLVICSEIGGRASSIKGSLNKDFPTTAAVAVCYHKGAELMTECLWVGDSRCYMLTQSGLVQLTEDDLGGIDPMENLSEDGVLTNVITSSGSFELHTKKEVLTEPTIIITASDGCFGYFSTPMEFEYLLVYSIVNSDSMAEAERKITDILDQTSGDDFTLTGLCLNYGTYPILRESLRPRAKFLYENYIRDLYTKSPREKLELWEKYKVHYLR